MVQAHFWDMTDGSQQVCGGTTHINKHAHPQKNAVLDAKFKCTNAHSLSDKQYLLTHWLGAAHTSGGEQQLCPQAACPGAHVGAAVD